MPNQVEQEVPSISANHIKAGDLETKTEDLWDEIYKDCQKNDVRIWDNLICQVNQVGKVFTP